MDTKDLENFQTLFRQKIEEHNSSVSDITTSSVVTDKIVQEYNKVKEAMNVLTNDYANTIKGQEIKIADTITQIITYLLYQTKLNKYVSDYQKSEKFIEFVLGNNDFIKLLNSLNAYLILYNTNKNKGTSTTAIETNIKIVALELIRILESNISANVFSDYTLSNEDASGHCQITTKSARSFSAKETTTSTAFTGARFYGFVGETDITGYVGQEDSVYVKLPVDKDNNPIKEDKHKVLTLISPMNGLSLKYTQNPGILPNITSTAITIPWFTFYDFISLYRGEPDDDDTDVGEDGLVEKTSTLRFGSIINITDIDLNASEQSIKIRYSKGDVAHTGSVTKQSVFEITSLNIQCKFNGEISTTDIDNYPASSHLSDTIDMEVVISDKGTAGGSYTFKGTDLKYDVDLSNEAKSNGSPASYYKGTMMYQTDDTTTAATYNANKEVIVSIASTNTNETTFKIDCQLDMDSTTNTSATDSESSNPLIYIPIFADQFTAELSLTNNVTITSTVLETTSALLDFVNLLKKIVNSSPFSIDEIVYSNITNRIEESKKSLLETLTNMLTDISNLCTTITTAISVYSTYDPNYISDYVSNITTYISDISSLVSEYTISDDTENLYNGTFSSKLIEYNDLLNSEFDSVLYDSILAENKLYKYDKSVCAVVAADKNNINFIDTLSSFYNIATVSTQTLSVLTLSGIRVPTFDINYTYSEWLSIYSSCIENSKFFYIDSYLLQYLYLLTQTYKIFNTAYNAGLCNQFEYIIRFIRIILTRIAKESLSNDYLNTSFNNKTISIIKNFSSIEYDLENFDVNDFNKTYINPYFSEIYSCLNDFNNINLNDLTLYNIDYYAKSLIYKGILQSTDIISDINKLYNFITKCNSYNVRELLVIVAFLSVLKELNSDSALRKYVDGLDLSIYDNYLNRIIYIVKYKNLIDSLDNPIIDMMTIPNLTDGDISNLEAQLKKSNVTNINIIITKTTQTEEIDTYNYSFANLLYNSNKHLIKYTTLDLSEDDNIIDSGTIVNSAKITYKNNQVEDKIN